MKKLISEEFLLSDNKTHVKLNIDYEREIINSKLIKNNYLVANYSLDFELFKTVSDNVSLLKEAFEFVKYKILESEREII